MSKKIDRTGEKFDYGEWRKYIIVSYVNAKDVTIQFLDKYKTIRKTTYDKCLKNQVQNPYEPTMCNVGYIGLLPDGSSPQCCINGKSTREYKLWCQMLERCYGTNSKDTYENCYVCDKWLCYVSFLYDLPHIENYELWINNPKQRISLDKDIKQPNFSTKIYSLDTCMFVTIQENVKESNSRQDHKTKMTSIYGVSVDDGTIIRFESMKQAEQFINVSHGTIRHSIKNKSVCKGYLWFKD